MIQVLDDWDQVVFGEIAELTHFCGICKSKKNLNCFFFGRNFIFTGFIRFCSVDRLSWNLSRCFWIIKKSFIEDNFDFYRKSWISQQLLCLNYRLSSKRQKEWAKGRIVEIFYRSDFRDFLKKKNSQRIPIGIPIECRTIFQEIPKIFPNKSKEFQKIYRSVIPTIISPLPHFWRFFDIRGKTVLHWRLWQLKKKTS